MIRVIDLEGRIIIEKLVGSKTEVNLDVSSFPNGAYILNIKGEEFNQSKKILIF
jgi:hypothetical protein